MTDWKAVFFFGGGMFWSAFAWGMAGKLPVIIASLIVIIIVDAGLERLRSNHD